MNIVLIYNVLIEKRSKRIVNFKTLQTISRMETSLGFYKNWGKSVMMCQSVRLEYLVLLLGSVAQVYSYWDY